MSYACRSQMIKLQPGVITHACTTFLYCTPEYVHVLGEAVTVELTSTILHSTRCLQESADDRSRKLLKA